MPFRSAWYRALRQITAPEDAAPETAAAYDEDRMLLREVRPHFQAAYEGRPVLGKEKRAVRKLADQRLADLVEADDDEIAAAA